MKGKKMNKKHLWSLTLLIALMLSQSLTGCGPLMMTGMMGSGKDGIKCGGMKCDGMMGGMKCNGSHDAKSKESSSSQKDKQMKCSSGKCGG
jgi:hypothetical protein